MKKKIIYLGLILLYKSILEIVYFYYVTPNYAYSGFIWNPNSSKYIISLIVLVVIILTQKINDLEPSSHLLSLILINTYIPIVVYYWITDSANEYYYYVSFCIFLIVIAIRFIRTFSIPIINLGKINYLDLTNFLLIFSVPLLSIFVIITGGIDVRALNFSSVYELRSELQFSGILGYLINWIPKVIIPILIIIYFYERKYLRLSIAIIMQLTFYLMTGHKSILFSIILLLSLAYLLKNRKYLYGLPIFFISMITISSLFYEVTKNNFFIALMPVRLLNLPAKISYDHYSFFLNNPKLFFSEGLIGKILNLESPYNISASRIIGGGDVNANTGFLGDAYGNAGFLAMISISILIMMFFKLIDSIAIHTIDTSIYTSLMIYTTIILNDTGLFTTLLTSGGLLMIIYIYILKSTLKSNTE